MFVYLCAYLSSSLSSPDEARRCPLSDDVRYVCRDARIMETWLFFDDRLSGWRRRRRRRRRRRKAVVRSAPDGSDKNASEGAKTTKTARAENGLKDQTFIA